jgi:uncharacterized protein (DUF4415 family)
MSGKTLKAKTGGRTDWSRIAATSDEDIETLAETDADNPATTEADWINAVAFVPPKKTTINARFDSDIVSWFKAQGPGYQPRMNAVLRKYMEAHTKTSKR